jgi:Tol biopolymer transport system component
LLCAGVLAGVSITAWLPAAAGATRVRGGMIAVVSLNPRRTQSSIVLIPADRPATAADSTVVVSGPGAISNLQWTPNGKTLVYDDAIDEDNGGPTHVYAVDLASRKRRLLVANLNGTDTDALSPDGKTLAYTQGLAETVAYLIPITGGAARKLHPGTHPAWSSDGSQIALEIFGATTSRIIAVTTTGAHTKLLYTSPNGAESIAWSPSGKSLLLETLDQAKAAAGDAGSSSIETISRSGAVLHVLSSSTDNPASYSPDGSQVVLEQTSPKANDSPSYVVMNADGSDRHTIDTAPVDGSGTAFSWSPDGRTIVTAEEYQGIRIVGSDGKHAQILDSSVGGSHLADPAWRPSG